MLDSLLPRPVQLSLEHMNIRIPPASWRLDNQEAGVLLELWWPYRQTQSNYPPFCSHARSLTQKHKKPPSRSHRDRTRRNAFLAKKQAERDHTEHTHRLPAQTQTQKPAILQAEPREQEAQSLQTVPDTPREEHTVQPEVSKSHTEELHNTVDQWLQRDRQCNFLIVHYQPKCESHWPIIDSDGLMNFYQFSCPAPLNDSTESDQIVSTTDSASSVEADQDVSIVTDISSFVEADQDVSLIIDSASFVEADQDVSITDSASVVEDATAEADTHEDFSHPHEVHTPPVQPSLSMTHIGPPQQLLHQPRPMMNPQQLLHQPSPMMHQHPSLQPTFQPDPSFIAQFHPGYPIFQPGPLQFHSEHLVHPIFPGPPMPTLFHPGPPMEPLFWPGQPPQVLQYDV